MMVEDDTEDYNDDEYGFDPSLHIYKPHVEVGDITNGGEWILTK